jgi:hypothetical protein
MTNSPKEKRSRKAKPRKFYAVDLDYRIRTPPGWKMENLALLANGGPVLFAPPGRGFPKYPEPPRFLIDKSLGRAPVDWELFHDYRIVSDRMKVILERLDRSGVAFVKCEMHYRDGSAGPIYWLCDVIRILDAVDESKSRLRIIYDAPDHKIYDLMGGGGFVFKEEVVGSAHIFRPRFYWVEIICDQSIKDACKDAGLKGMSFRDAAHC